MKVRIISGVVGAILAVAILLLHKTFVFPLAIAALICIALFELFRAGKCLHCRISIGAGFLYGAALPFLQYYGNYTAVIALTFLCIIAMFAEMVLLHKRVTYQSTLFIAAITLLVSHSLSMLNTLLHISSYGLASVILALCSAWVADTGAYFAGTFLGKHKLCPEISPKPWKVSLRRHCGRRNLHGDFRMIYSLIAHAHVHYLWLIFIGIVCAVISVLGDLSASVLKRQQGIKDFGNIMPGHGGVMDRFDSVLFTVPAFYALEMMYRYSLDNCIGSRAILHTTRCRRFALCRVWCYAPVSKRRQKNGNVFQY
ncbi:MAG: phosphatidate cytidylyltransferase [Ruminococcus callidus]